MTRTARAVGLVLALAAVGAGCERARDDGTAPAEKAEDLPLLLIHDDTPNLLLTWVDAKGDAHVELHPADVPMEGRDAVRVVVSDRQEGTRDQFYVVDLTKKQPDGSYEARTMPRREWEGLLEKRRDAQLPKPEVAAAPPAGAHAAPHETGQAAPPGATGDFTVIIYGASWCGPCHQAADYLKKRGVKYVMKDVEQDPGAGVEMKGKLAKVGRSGGSIPVIDVRGQIMVGFSPGAMDQALSKASSGTVL